MPARRRRSPARDRPPPARLCLIYRSSKFHRLCATATVVGASAVGLSFGRENPVDPPSKKKATPARDSEYRPVPAPVQRPATSFATSFATPSFSAPFPPAQPPTSSRAPVASRSGQDGRSRRLVRRMTSAEPSLRPNSWFLNGYTPPSEHDNIDEVDAAAYNPSRRPSWIKRLSGLSTSRDSSRTSSPGPQSPSISASNGSMAFSHDGSTAPIIGDRPPPPLPRNKLVKRSSSVRNPHDGPVQGPASLRPTFRRPATSHQRSATLQHQVNLMEVPAETPSSDEHQLPSSNDSSEVEYTQFFTARVSKEKTSLYQRRASLPNAMAKGFRRIFPDEKHKPTLMLAKSVCAGTEEVDESASDDGDSVYLISRPATPVSITAVNATAAQPPNNPVENVTSERHRPSEDLTDDGARSRRSFSISELLSPASNAKKQRVSKLPAAAPKLTRSSSQRSSSAPLSTMGKRPSNTADGIASAATARREFTDPVPVRRQISTSAGPAETGNLRHGISTGSSSPLPALPTSRTAAQPESTPASMHPGDVRPSTSAGTNHVPPSHTLAHTGGRPSRHSVAPSEQASTLVGSDNEARGVGSGDEDDVDLQSETVFDSLRTGATRSTSGARGPRIETIFDESPPSKIKVTALRDLLPKGTFREQTTDGAPGHQSIAEEDESISTPVRTIVPDRSLRDSPSFSRGHSAPLFPSLIPSSPPDMPKPLSLGTLEWDSRAEDDDSSSRWSLDDDDDPWGDLPTRSPATQVATPVSIARHNLRLLASGSSPKPTTPQHLIAEHGDRDARSSIFDWSEQQPADKSSGNRTPPRPRTVHGKKDADRRGSRSVGRRAPSGLHARSQSVPVVPDATGKRSTVVTNKFGTWGVGSKGVTEDWNDDFDFSDLHEQSPAGAADSHRIDSGTAMFVPKNIQEQQSNVLANIGLLREWGLLIEELKEQKVRAAALGILEGPNGGIWEEVDAMIDLADQEADHEEIPPRLSPPSSPGFDEGAFDDVSGPSPNHGRGRRASGLANEELGRNHTPPVPQPNTPRRKSILPPNYDIFGPQTSPPASESRYELPATPESKPIVITRPRKDSEAKARSVIEALQKRKSIVESPGPDLPPTPTTTTKKVPFDTATLRRIVPYVNTLTHQVKNALREAEGLVPSPSTSPQETPFNRLFQAENELSTQMKLMTVM
ncbi:hypothetical protein BS50DRAFT_582704 [Corynespora cassiicola Philippines]|uniref:Uncharacterized protein n=1 Tax=Corynespora cassiicola Philippines TaxID=1448308 RepID=A0A2T2P6C0_CORCC|nr:hypothetical protein BS50DRAFT_582704 [Corynespora cassiicola Philippines]